MVPKILYSPLPRIHFGIDEFDDDDPYRREADKMNPDTSRFRNSSHRGTGRISNRQLSGLGSEGGERIELNEEELKLLGIQPKNLDDHGPQFSGLNRLA